MKTQRSVVKPFLVMALLALLVVSVAPAMAAAEAPGTTRTISGATAMSASADAPWSGTWNTSFGSGNGTLGGRLILNQSGSSVTGIDYNGTVIATVQGNSLSGTWFDSSAIGHEIGVFELVLSQDANSFTGSWAPSPEGAVALRNSTRFWKGVRE